MHHYLKRYQELGFSQCCLRLTQRCKRTLYGWYLRRKAYAGSAAHSWQKIAKNHVFSSDFGTFFSEQLNKKTITTLLCDPLFARSLPCSLTDTQMLNHSIDDGKSLTIDLLGLALHKHDPEKIAWQRDSIHDELKRYYRAPFKTPFTQPCTCLPTWHNRPNIFYQDIAIEYPQKLPENVYHPDIKIPWELSRMQFLFPYGLAFYQQQAENDHLSKLFVRTLTSWLDKNPFLLGACWVCPMDVAIRAANMIILLHLFQKSSSISLSFWQRLVCSLYDHAWYLERNWETSDKPSNHYLSDLVGYFFITTIFAHDPYFAQQQKWVRKEILTQAEKQLLADGCSYEGSSSYHRLVTELFFHALLIIKAEDSIPEEFSQKIAYSFDALADMIAGSPERLIQIGDTDSGIFIAGLTNNKSSLHSIAQQLAPKHIHITKDTVSSIRIRDNFGLIRIQTNRLVATLRLATLSAHQPSGHFHDDALSITLYIDQIPILIDPGTFVYTANATWRNQLRSAHAHSTFSIGKQHNPDHLFLLDRPVWDQSASVKQIKSEQRLLATASAPAATNSKTKRTRRIDIDKKIEKIYITDTWEHKKMNDQIQWSFIFHPALTIIQNQQTQSWSILYKDIIMAILHPSLSLVQEQAWFSPRYGHSKKTTALRTYTKNAKQPVTWHIDYTKNS